MQEKISRYALTALIPLIIILGSFGITFIDKNFYYDEIKSNNIDMENAGNITISIIGYLKTGSAIKPALSNDETEHLKDVRFLIVLAFLILFASAVAAVALAAVMAVKDKHQLFNSLYWGGIITALMIVALLFAITVAFDQAFYIFHKTLFTNNLWLLPADSTLIRLFPWQFFLDFAKRIGLNSLIISLLIIIVGRMKR